MATFDLRLLGPVAVERDGEELALQGPKQRLALALLACRPGLVVSTDRLVEALWGVDPPKTAATALQGHVSRLRRLLADDVIATRAPGYVLELPPETVDAARFERLVERARREQPAERAETLAAALALWRGAPLADLVGISQIVEEEASRLNELRLAAQEDLFDARLALGLHAALVPELEAFVRSEPLRERVVGQLMLALYRSGRQVDALAVYRSFSRELRETVGLEPEQPLRDLERRILAQDPSLAPVAGTRSDAPRRLPLTAAAVGLAPDGDDLDAEAYARATARAREAVRLALERHGATVERAGNAVVGLFGTPTPREDDAVRALAAAQTALAAVEKLAELDDGTAPVRARAGVASGVAFGGESPAIEAAIRLQADVPPGELATDETTRARARARELRTGGPLAGRDAECRHLRERWDAAVRDRRSDAVSLVGTAGIGKSRLAVDFLASLEPPKQVLRARCLSYGDGIALLPAAELVRSALALDEAGTADAARERLTAILAGDARTGAAVELLLGLLDFSESTDDEGAGWAVRRLVERLAERAPVAVLIDDLHWASPDFLTLVEQLVQPTDAPIVVLTTARDEEAATSAGEALHLAPLSAEACAAIVGDLVGGPVDETALHGLVERSGGNPLYLEELVLDANATGRLREADGRWMLDDAGEWTPPSLESLLAMRIERLSPEERELLSHASVIGKSFPLAAVADLAADAGPTLDALVAGGFLQPSAEMGDDLEFRHLLIRDAAYAALPLDLRAELHERYAAWLDLRVAPALQRGPFAVYHLDQAYRARAALAPDSPSLETARAELAVRTGALGRALLARGDAREAVGPLARALELAPDDPLLAIELGRARFDAGDLAAADEAFVQAVEGPLADRALLGRLEVRLHTDTGCDLGVVGREIAGLLAAIRERGDAEGEAEALFASAYIAVARGRAGDVGPILEEALALTRGSGRSHAEAEILFLVCGSCWYGPLPVADGIRRCERVLAEASERPTVEAAARQALAVLHAMNGDFEEARKLVRTSQAIWQDVGRAVAAAATAIDVGIVELLAGDYATAEAVLREGYDELERLGETAYFSTLAALLAGAIEAQRRPDDVHAPARAAAAAAARGDAATQAGWRSAEARALAATGAHDEAQRLAAEAVSIADATDFAFLRADAWAAFADVAGARGDGRAATHARMTAISALEQKGLARAAIVNWARLRSSP